MTLTALPPALFAEVASPLPATVISPKPGFRPAFIQRSRTPDQGDSGPLCIAPAQGVFREADHVNRNAAGSIEVGGLVETAEEREELRAALRAVPGVILKVQTVAEAMQATATAVLDRNEVPGASPRSDSVKVRSGPMPLRLPLQQYFSKNGLREETADPVASLSNGAVTLSRNIMARSMGASTPGWGGLPGYPQRQPAPNGEVAAPEHGARPHEFAPPQR